MRTLTCMPREPLVFGQPARPELVEQRLHLERDAAHVGPRDARARIEIDAQLVGMIEVAGAHRVRMQLDAAEVDDPGEARRVVDDDLLGGAPRRKRQRHRAQPVGPLLGRALLVEGLALGAVDEALEHDRAVADAGERAVAPPPGSSGRGRAWRAAPRARSTACSGCVTRTSRPATVSSSGLSATARRLPAAQEGHFNAKAWLIGKAPWLVEPLVHHVQTPDDFNVKSSKLVQIRRAAPERWAMSDESSIAPA